MTDYVSLIVVGSSNYFLLSIKVAMGSLLVVKFMWVVSIAFSFDIISDRYPVTLLI
jgi:hypothetical protein